MVGFTLKIDNRGSLRFTYVPHHSRGITSFPRSTPYPFSAQRKKACSPQRAHSLTGPKGGMASHRNRPTPGHDSSRHLLLHAHMVSDVECGHFTTICQDAQLQGRFSTCPTGHRHRERGCLLCAALPVRRRRPSRPRRKTRRHSCACGQRPASVRRGPG